MEFKAMVLPIQTVAKHAMKVRLVQLVVALTAKSKMAGSVSFGARRVRQSAAMEE